jgi:hypothetical protein
VSKPLYSGVAEQYKRNTAISRENKTVFCVGCSDRRKFKDGAALGTANTKNGWLSADLKK